MDREYLEDYAQKEESEYERLLRNIKEGKFSFDKDRFPHDERFVKLQKPVASTTLDGTLKGNFWAQLPFCGSLILLLQPFSKTAFEELFFKVSEIPKIIEFIKETGRLQIAIDQPRLYEGLDYFDPIFRELNPPTQALCPTEIFADKKEIQKATTIFRSLIEVSYAKHVYELEKEFEEIYGISKSERLQVEFVTQSLRQALNTYVILKLGHYTIAEDIENSLVDDPSEAIRLIKICSDFIADLIQDLRSDLQNFTLEDVIHARKLPAVYQPQKIRFPCEIGRFLLKKLTYAPLGMGACRELMYHYDTYDLQKALEALNEAIVTNHPEDVYENAEELSEILENVWKDVTISRRITGIKIGVPLLMAAVGYVVAGTIGAAGGGLLGDMGFKVAEKTVRTLFDAETTGLSERLAKFRTRSSQANIYNFKKKYKGKITPS